MKNVINWFAGERKMPSRAWSLLVLKATIGGFLTMTVLALCGCGDAPSLGGPNQKDPTKFAEYLVTEFAKGNFKPYEKYASLERKDKLEKEAARVKDRRREGNSQVKTSLEELDELFKKAERECGKVVSYGVYSMTPSDKYASSGREAMTVKFWIIREHFTLTDTDRRWLCSPNDAEEECKKKRTMGRFLVVKEHDGQWYIN